VNLGASDKGGVRERRDSSGREIFLDACAAPIEEVPPDAGDLGMRPKKDLALRR